MNKARRHELKMLKYKKRIRRFAAKCGTYITRNGERLSHPKTINIIKDNGQVVYRSHSTPCSCIFCSHSKYDRAKEKSRSIQNRD